MASPTLSGLDTATFNENTVNATPQVIDGTVAFDDVDGDFNGGTLTVSGLLAEDTVSILSGSVISLSGGVVYHYDAGSGLMVAIGTVSGGVGATLTVTFNAAATSAAIDALIQNLTYANSSDTPTASRTLTINVTDAAGGDAGVVPGPQTFSAAFGAANPFDGFVAAAGYSAPALVDLDGDGDLDLVLGNNTGDFNVYRNGTTGSAGAFTQLTGGDNPLNGLLVFTRATPTFTDLDGDGDLDLVAGDSIGTLNVFRNGTAGAAGAFTQLTGGDNPFNGIDVGQYSAPTFTDLDGDGDLDLVVGERDGTLNVFRNGTVGAAGAFTAVTGVDNPFNGIDVASYSAPTFADLDGDGDLDLVVGNSNGTLIVFRNGTAGTAGAFTELTATDNPFDGVSVSMNSTPTFADLDGDGDLDAVAGNIYGYASTFFNTTAHGRTVTVTVTAQQDPTAGADTLDGTSGNDTIRSLDGNDTVDAGDGDDTVDGGDGDDIIDGGAGADYLKGGLGADAMSGGTGNDTYVVDDIGDTTDETGGDGTDRVISRISWTLAAAIENLTLGNGGTINGTGNELDNVITGNSVANTLNGLAGNDTLSGGGGNDVLYGDDDDDTLDGGTQNDRLYGDAGIDTLNGGAGHDTLDGGTGADVMAGGAGNDSYVVDDADDAITEAVGEGTDSVTASVSYTLSANIESLTLTGGAEIGAGNALANTITGNAFGNTLIGGDGNDVVNGMAGADYLYGGNGNDTLDGGQDNDFLFGGAGQDRLTGGTGADAFVFTDADIRRTGPGFGLAGDKDQILDLSFAANDLIGLGDIDANAILGGDQAFVFVANFSGVAGQATLKFISGKSILQLDVDGDRKADLIVEINGNVTGTTANLYTGAGDTDGGWVL